MFTFSADAAGMKNGDQFRCTGQQRRSLGPGQLMAMQNRVAPLGVDRREARQRLENRQIRRQFHFLTHRGKVESRIDQRAVEIEDNAANHGAHSSRQPAAIVAAHRG